MDQAAFPAASQTNRQIPRHRIQCAFTQLGLKRLQPAIEKRLLAIDIHLQGILLNHLLFMTLSTHLLHTTPDHPGTIGERQPQPDQREHHAAPDSCNGRDSPTTKRGPSHQARTSTTIHSSTPKSSQEGFSLGNCLRRKVMIVLNISDHSLRMSYFLRDAANRSTRLTIPGSHCIRPNCWLSCHMC